MVLTKYEEQYARQNGIPEYDIQDMHSWHEEDPLPECTDGFDEHAVTCDCKKCLNAMVVECECDEDNDHYELKIQEWKRRVADERVKRAKRTLDHSEKWIDEYITRCAQSKLEQEERLAYEKAYVLIPGTSAWLEFGKLSQYSKDKLAAIPGFRSVETYTKPDKAIKLRMYVDRPIGCANNERMDAHFRILIQFYMKVQAHHTDDDLEIHEWWQSDQLLATNKRKACPDTIESDTHRHKHAKVDG